MSSSYTAPFGPGLRASWWRRGSPGSRPATPGQPVLTCPSLETPSGNYGLMGHPPQCGPTNFDRRLASSTRAGLCCVDRRGVVAGGACGDLGLTARRCGRPCRAARGTDGRDAAGRRGRDGDAAHRREVLPMADLELEDVGGEHATRSRRSRRSCRRWVNPMTERGRPRIRLTTPAVGLPPRRARHPYPGGAVGVRPPRQISRCLSRRTMTDCSRAM